jgi:glucan phosphoethanolaminetransferase (alkaline phosphatase superfamily)
MSDNKTSNSTGGIGFCGLLTIVFIVLKLCKVIEWSWIWVLSPLWIPILIVILVLIIIFIFAIIFK